MKQIKTWWRPASALLTGAIILVCGFMLVANTSVAMQDTKTGKKQMHTEAFSVYQKNCLACHDSVADPEKPGRTRDEWLMVVEMMHSYGFDLTHQESEMIIDLLFDIRKGLEKEAG